MSELAPGEVADHYLDLKLIMALLRQLRRSGVLNEGMCQNVRTDFLADVAYHEGNSSQLDYMSLIMMLDEFEERALGKGASEFRAAQKRKALREWNTRPAPIDGGNSED